MAGEIKSQGTNLYFLDTDGTTVVQLTNVKSISGLGGQKSDIDVTNLDSTAKEYLVGLEDPGTLTFDINFAPASSVHQALWDLKESGTRVDWCLGLSDGTSDPTASSGSLVAPTSGRSNWMFEGSVQQFPINVDIDGVVSSSLSVRVSGSITYNPKTP